MFRIGIFDRILGYQKEKKKLNKKQWIEEVQDDPGHWKPLGDWSLTFEPPPVKKELSERKKARRARIKARLRDYALNKIHSGVSSRLFAVILEVSSMVLTNSETKLDDVVTDAVVLAAMFNTGSAIVLSFRFDTKKKNRKHFEYLRRQASDQLTDLLVPALQEVGDSNAYNPEAADHLMEDLHSIIAVQKKFVRETLEARIDEMMQLASDKVDENLDNAEAKVADKLDSGAVGLAKNQFKKKVQLAPVEGETEAKNVEEAEPTPDQAPNLNEDAAAPVEAPKETNTPNDSEEEAPVTTTERDGTDEPNAETKEKQTTQLDAEPDANTTASEEAPAETADAAEEEKQLDAEPEANTTASEEAPAETADAAEEVSDPPPAKSQYDAEEGESDPAVVATMDSESSEKVAESSEGAEPDTEKVAAEPAEGEVGPNAQAEDVPPEKEEPQERDSTDLGETKTSDSLIPAIKKSFSSADSAKESVQGVRESLAKSIRDNENLQKVGADMVERIPDRQSMKKAKSSLKKTKDEIIATFGVQVRELIVSQMEDLPDHILTAMDRVIQVVSEALSKAKELKENDEKELQEKVYQTIAQIHEDSMNDVSDQVQGIVDMMGGMMGKKKSPQGEDEEDDSDDEEDGEDGEEGKEEEEEASGKQDGNGAEEEGKQEET